MHIGGSLTWDRWLLDIDDQLPSVTVMYHVAVNSAGMQDQDGRLLAETECPNSPKISSAQIRNDCIDWENWDSKASD